MTPLRMLALSPVPEEGAGCRFRVAQYVPALESAGVHVTISPFFTTEFFRLVYRRGHALKKSLLFAERAVDRFRTVTERARYDVIFIYREALPIGPAIVESLFARASGVALIYDFDDAVYLPNTSEANRAIAALKWPRKVRSIVRRSDCVIAGNEYLAAWARTYSDAVRVIPTCVDTDKFVPRAGVPLADVPRADVPPSGSVRLQPDPNMPIIGWIGTPTTVPYLLSLQSIFQDLARTHRFVLRICGAGADVQIPGVKVDNVPWTLDAEVSLFNTCDIGVYPLSDDEWARGKCGFKAIQFMACGVPVVAAPVGVNREILRDGVNGLLAATPAEWIEKLGRLLASAPLRAELGVAGRATMEAEYSLKVNAPKVVAAVHDAVERARRRAAGVAPVPVGVSRT